VTARWVVDEVVPQREVNVVWRSISLLEKNKPEPGSDYEKAATFSHGLLRVFESVKRTEGNEAAGRLYREFGARIHHDGVYDFAAADALTTVGLDPVHAAAFDDASWDEVIRAEMAEGLGMTGDDVGTPILALPDRNGKQVALFGPVITRVPEPELSLQLWDGFVAVAQVPGFWELKRTRTERPEFGERPS
jgi:hypothetical protein